ncbi:MAG: radical SAM protein [Bacteriovoracaceae bacterium]|nr:radical SAM protein [Bacteriovoracaceae bacterium]
MYKRVYIEISNICNLQCSFCPIVDRDNKVLEVDNFQKIIKQVAPITKEVCLHLMGEPIAHPHFSKVIDICTNLNVPIQLTTNGVVIAQKKHILLKDNSIRQVNFSIQSYKDNFPDRPLKDYLIPIFEFSDELYKKRPDIYINYRLWNLKENEEVDNDEFFDLLESYFNIEVNRRIQVEAIKSKKLREKLYLHFDSRFNWPDFDLPMLGTGGRCHGLISHIGIHADGTVVPCCLDKEARISLGNCLEQDLREILSSERAMKMKIGFQNNQLVEDLCQRCPYIRRFN